MSPEQRQACEDAGRGMPPDPREVVDQARKSAREDGTVGVGVSRFVPVALQPLAASVQLFARCGRDLANEAAHVIESANPERRYLSAFADVVREAIADGVVAWRELTVVRSLEPPEPDQESAHSGAASVCAICE